MACPPYWHYPHVLWTRRTIISMACRALVAGTPDLKPGPVVAW